MIDLENLLRVNVNVETVCANPDCEAKIGIGQDAWFRRNSSSAQYHMWYCEACEEEACLVALERSGI